MAETVAPPPPPGYATAVNIGIAIAAFNSSGDNNGDSNSDCQSLVELLLFHKVANHSIVFCLFVFFSNPET